MDWAAIAAAGATVASTGLQVGANSNMNRKSRRFSRQMYERQRADNLADYHMQNAYNHPAAQVARLKEAGLNPALMYSGAGGGGASAESIRSSDVQRPEYSVPDFQGAGRDLINSLLVSADLEQKDAQTNQTRALTTVAIEDALLRAEQRRNLQFDYGLKSDLRDTSVDAAREQLRKVRLEMDLALREDERRAAINASNLKEAVERILTMQANRTLTPLEYKRLQATVRDTNLAADLKQQDLRLRKQGIYPGDPLYVRFATTKAQEALQSVKETLPKLKQAFEKARPAVQLQKRVQKRLPFIPFK